MSKIWEPNFWYRFLRPYVDLCTRASFWKLKAEGKLPEDGAVIIAPNHTNTLMDALVVLQTRKSPTFFGARADIFRNPVARRALSFLRILPFTRERDGLRSVTDNYKTFDEIEDALEHGLPFCMFPEGRHTPGRTLQTIQKGIARIAFRSAANGPTYVVPTGINYSHFFRYRGTAHIQFGEPLDVNAFLKAREDLTEAAQYQSFREEVYNRVSELVWPDAPALKHPLALKILLFPFWLLAAVMSFPMWLTAELLCRKIKDKAFSNTVRFCIRLVFWPITGIIWCVLLFCLLPWWLAAALLLFFIPSYSIFYDGIYRP